MIVLLIAAHSVLQASSDTLELFSSRRVSVEMGRLTDTKTGRLAALKEIARSAVGNKFVFLGETHDNVDAHRWQLRIIEQLNMSRNVIIGLEMLQRQKQAILHEWTLDKLTEADFLQQSEWQTQWGFDFSLYKSIFDYARERRLRMAALNIPRDWVRTVGRDGLQALPDEAKRQLPELYLKNENHRKVFEALIGGHPAGGSLDNMYAAQVLWDEAMADSAIKYLQNTIVTDKTLFVILTGNGHVLYKHGINYRLKRQANFDSVTVVTVEIPKGKRVLVSADIADFVIGVPQVERQ